MKKVKYLSVILALTMLSGCAKANSSPSENNERIVWTYGNADEKGELYTDSEERLHFFDFDTMQSAVLCSKPNCTHTNENECSAFGMRNHPILYGDKLYFFDVKTNFNGDEITDTTTVYKADVDGTNRVKVLISYIHISIRNPRRRINIRRSNTRRRRSPRSCIRRWRTSRSRAGSRS